VQEITVDGDVVFSAVPAGAFDITQFSLDATINAQDNPEDIAFNDDGTRLYEVSTTGDKIYQYTLSTPFELSTATFQNSVNTRDSAPTSIEWNDDGTKLYELGRSANEIQEFSVSTPFDATTATFSTSISTQNTTSEGIGFNVDGTRFYEVGRGSPGDEIYEYTLSTAFDISTASFQRSKNTNNNPSGVAISNDGSLLHVTRFSPDVIEQFTLSTPFDISTASSDATISSQGAFTTGIKWNNDGSRLYTCDYSNKEIYQFIL
jgi:sugar lactone lactonase YvrE